MEARAAGHDVHVLRAPQDLLRGRAEGGFEQPAVRKALLERVRDRARLLVDLLQHVVRIGAALGRIRRQIALAHRPLHDVPIAIDDPHAPAAHFGDVALLEEDEAPRDGQQRRDVRGHEILILAEPEHDRATLARHDQPLGLVLAHHRECVGPLKLGHRGTHGLEEVLDGLQVIVDAVGDDLGVGLGGEPVAAALEIGTQLLVVLDDAVVHDREAVARDVRMRVAL